MTGLRNPNWPLIAVGAVLIGGGGLALGFMLGTGQPARNATTDNREVLYWYDPMYPEQHFDKPGKSPFMDMQLVPRHAGEAEPTAPAVSIDPGVVQNLGVRLAPVARSSIGNDVQASAVVGFNERDV